MKDFLLKCIVFFIVFGLPLSLMSFFVLGCIWFWKNTF